jgi:hypothetical protein
MVRPAHLLRHWTQGLAGSPPVKELFTPGADRQGVRDDPSLPHHAWAGAQTQPPALVTRPPPPGLLPSDRAALQLTRSKLDVPSGPSREPEDGRVREGPRDWPVTALNAKTGAAT